MLSRGMKGMDGRCLCPGGRSDTICISPEETGFASSSDILAFGVGCSRGVLSSSRPPASPSSSTTGRVAPAVFSAVKVRSRDLSSEAPCFSVFWACFSAFWITLSVECLENEKLGCRSVWMEPSIWSVLLDSRSACSFVFVRPVMNLTKRSPYSSGGIGDIWDLLFDMPFHKCSALLMKPYYVVNQYVIYS